MWKVLILASGEAAGSSTVLVCEGDFGCTTVAMLRMPMVERSAGRTAVKARVVRRAAIVIVEGSGLISVSSDVKVLRGRCAQSLEQGTIELCKMRQGCFRLQL